MALTGIPVTMFGVNVGSAKLHDDGTVELTMGSPNAMGKDLISQFEAGQHVALAIMPVSIPSPPLTPSVEKALTEAVGLAISASKKPAHP